MLGPRGERGCFFETPRGCWVWVHLGCPWAVWPAWQGPGVQEEWAWPPGLCLWRQNHLGKLPWVPRARAPCVGLGTELGGWWPGPLLQGVSVSGAVRWSMTLSVPMQRWP